MLETIDQHHILQGIDALGENIVLSTFRRFEHR
jgi:hypothetical protein